MYVVAGILFVLPCGLLVAALMRLMKDIHLSGYASWRRYAATISLCAATLATLLAVAYICSWLYNGGSPHGMNPSPGLWIRIGPLLRWPTSVGFILGWFGKGRARILLVGWAPALAFALCVTYMLQMD